MDRTRCVIGNAYATREVLDASCVILLWSWSAFSSLSLQEMRSGAIGWKASCLWLRIWCYRICGCSRLHFWNWSAFSKPLINRFAVKNGCVKTPERWIAVWDSHRPKGAGCRFYNIIIPQRAYSLFLISCFQVFPFDSPLLSLCWVSRSYPDGQDNEKIRTRGAIENTRSNRKLLELSLRARASTGGRSTLRRPKISAILIALLFNTVQYVQIRPISTICTTCTTCTIWAKYFVQYCTWIFGVLYNMQLMFCTILYKIFEPCCLYMLC